MPEAVTDKIFIEYTQVNSKKLFKNFVFSFFFCFAKETDRKPVTELRISLVKTK